jgi:acetyl-CoA acetyltransferase
VFSCRELDVAVVGVGATPQGSLGGAYSGDDLAVWALKEALADAGLEKTAIDGLFVQSSFGGAGDIEEVSNRLGLEPTYATNTHHHGDAVHLGAQLIASGACQTVAAVYGTNQKSNRNPFGATARSTRGNYEQVYGLGNPGNVAAFNFRRRMHDFGATEEQLGAVAVAQSKAAALNPLAVFRTPLTLEDYLSMRYVIAPLRLADFSMISDGGFAFILSAGARARDLEKRPVYIRGLGAAASALELEHPAAMYHPSQVRNAAMLWGSTDLTRSDVDILYVQDAYTPNVLAALENFGFCEFGTAHEWIQDGRIELGGALPVNPNGGQNRMTYMVGWQNTFDAVQQLRGAASEPPRQVADAGVALCTFSSGHWRHTYSVLYAI